MTYAFSRYIIIVVVIYYKIAKMKTITIKRRRRMTKHRKGMTKPRKSNRRIKNRKHKTRRQSGGGGWESFIKAQHNPRSGVKGKGIDVKVEVDQSNTPVRWLIGGNKLFDATFGELKASAKDGRYREFIDALESDNAAQKPLLLLNFTDPGRTDDSSKGIWLSHDQFCRLFISDSNSLLHYPELSKRFHQRQYTCTGTSGPSGAVAPRGPSSASAAGTSASSSASAAGTSAAGTSAASLGPQLTPNVLQLINMGFSQADAMNALKMYNNNVNHAANYLSDPAPRGGVVAQPGFGLGPTRAPTSAEPAWVAQLKKMGYGQSLINQALEKGIKSVDDAIDYISSMSQAEQVLPVTNLSFIHTIAIADLMNPDVFVTKYVQYYGLQFVKTDSYQIDLHNRSLRDFNKCPDVADWLVMQTIGDGNCLTHAFLQCRSSMYRKIHVKNKERPDEKIAVAQAFRLAFARSNDARFSLNKNPIVMNELTAGDGRTDLGEGTFAYYAVLFNVILVVFDINQNAIMVANLTKDTAKTDMPVIFVHGDGIHFSSVLPANPSHAEPYVLTYETAIKIECLKEPLSLTNPVVFNL